MASIYYEINPWHSIFRLQYHCCVPGMTIWQAQAEGKHKFSWSCSWTGFSVTKTACVLLLSHGSGHLLLQTSANCSRQQQNLLWSRRSVQEFRSSELLQCPMHSKVEAPLDLIMYGFRWVLGKMAATMNWHLKIRLIVSSGAAISIWSLMSDWTDIWSMFCRTKSIQKWPTEISDRLRNPHCWLAAAERAGGARAWVQWESMTDASARRTRAAAAEAARSAGGKTP